jgi:hypothetical protein
MRVSYRKKAIFSPKNSIYEIFFISCYKNALKTRIIFKRFHISNICLENDLRRRQKSASYSKDFIYRIFVLKKASEDAGKVHGFQKISYIEYLP